VHEVFNVLEENGLSIELLERLSFHSNLGQSLKRNLHCFDKEELFNDLSRMVDWLDEQECLGEIGLDYRIKSIDSIKLKYERYFPNRQVRQVFNDILGFRAYCDNYNEVISLKTDYFRVVDMSLGKANDDGYRGVHLYYQIDNSYYPIEIQFNTYYDRQLNNWLHKYLYKRDYDNAVGKMIRSSYENGRITDEKNFKEVLDYVLSSC